MKNKLLSLPLVLIVLVLVCGCSPQPTSTSINVTVLSPTQGSGYPAAQESGSPYPATNNDLATETSSPSDPVQTPDMIDPNNGAVEGTLMVRIDSQPTAVTDRILYLAPILADDQGIERVAALDRQNSPKTATGSSGNFSFVNVPPGNYGLILDVVVDSYLLNQPDTGDAMVITVGSGETINLGELVFDELPLPPQ
jgi:hypothetical protein